MDLKTIKLQVQAGAYVYSEKGFICRARVTLYNKINVILYGVTLNHIISYLCTKIILHRRFYKSITFVVRVVHNS